MACFYSDPLAWNPTGVDTPPGGRRQNPNFPYVRCCHCGKRRHWKGHVVRDDRGETYIIGASKCGREHYGIRYNHAESAFKEEMARRSAIGRWTNMRALVPVYRADIEKVLQCEGLKLLELKRELSTAL